MMSLLRDLLPLALLWPFRLRFPEIHGPEVQPVSVFITIIYRSCSYWN